MTHERLRIFDPDEPETTPISGEELETEPADPLPQLLTALLTLHEQRLQAISHASDLLALRMIESVYGSEIPDESV
jgi:hypothetical protein